LSVFESCEIVNQAIDKGGPGFRVAVVQPVSMGSAMIPFFTKVKSLGLTINSRFPRDDQINIVCRRVCLTLKRGLLLPLGMRLQLARSLVVPLFLYCVENFSNMAVGLRDRL
jgi:hypothetical protein